MPFQNTHEREIHFVKHGHKFGVPNATEYERMADEFMFGPMLWDTQECVRSIGLLGTQDRVRFGFRNHHQGIACVTPQFLRTFHPVELRFIAARGGEARYFAYQCGRIGGVDL